MIEGAIGPYIVWENNGYEGWRPKSYNNLKEALEGERYTTEFVVTKKCEYVIAENG